MKQGSGAEEFRPDDGLRSFLSSIEPDTEVLPWSKVEGIVADAAPAHVPWSVRLLGTGRRPMRLAVGTASLVMVMAVSILGIVPAQSNSVGTLVFTDMPASWAVDGPEFTELHQAAFDRFNALDAPESRLFLKVKAREGKDQLVFVMLGVPNAEATEYFSGIADTYPAVEAAPATIVPIDSGQYSNLLHELVVKLTPLAADDDALGLHVVRSLKAAGFEDINYSIQHLDNGQVVIEIDAAPPVQLDAGGEDFQALMEELEAKN